MYEFVMRMKEMYSALQDDLSRNIFWARLNNDFCHDGNSVLALAALRSGLTADQSLAVVNWKEAIRAAQEDNGKLVIYGTSLTGRTVAELFIQERIDFFGFCGRNAQKFTDNLMNKPVVSPEWLIQNSKEHNFYVIMAVTVTNGGYNEVMAFLEHSQFPRDHILDFYTFPCSNGSPPQYFEFPDLIPRGRAFVDGGSGDGSGSVQFAKSTGGNYTKIFAFEPDHMNYMQTLKTIEDTKLPNVEVFKMGLSSRSSIVESFAGDSGCGHIQTEREPTAHVKAVWEKYQNPSVLPQHIDLVCLDNVIKDHNVGMIKMDIEGSEYDALQGAEHTIRRDKPFLAITVYHLTGDVLAIMDVCKKMVPEYRFWLRQYDSVPCETVLYASV